MRNLTLLFIFMLLPQAFALGGDPCVARLTQQPVPVEVRGVFLNLQKLGLGSLLEEVYANKVKVSVRTKWMPYQPAVSARVNWIGRKSLVIREIDISTSEKQQKFTWDVALSLYELQMQPWLWSGRSVFSNGPASNALAVGEDEDALAYFAMQMPQEWRDQYLEKAQRMLRELYVLFLTLPELRSEDLMAAKDPGRAWILRGLAMMNATHAIAPNQADFELLKSKGVAQLEHSIAANNSRSILFNYYMNHVKRMLLVTFMAANIPVIPHLTEIPSYFEAQREWSKYEETLRHAPTRADATMTRAMEHRRQREIERLNSEITLQENKTPRDEALISSLKAQLQENIERNAAAVYTDDPSGPPSLLPLPAPRTATPE